jgi:ubiquinone/menaquinone biosynthesis C-methylase UbiE
MGTIAAGKVVVPDFLPEPGCDEALIRGFGAEWVKFNVFTDEELDTVGPELFDLWPDAAGRPVDTMVDIGCGSGRWTRYLASRVAYVDALDPSEALLEAATVHADLPNVRWTRARAEALPFPDAAFDMALCIGVLHHLKDPVLALREAHRVLRPGALLYFYVYYALEQRGGAYRLLFKASDLLRRVVYRMPDRLKQAVCELIAVLVYGPLVAVVRIAKRLGFRHWQRLPLAFYHNKSFRIMRNDALDRFGTSHEQRYTQHAISAMLVKAGFTGVRFSDVPPYWHGTALRP